VAPLASARIERSGKVSMDFHVAEVVWEFFTRRRLTMK
jgi:hypothetical protein